MMRKTPRLPSRLVAVTSLTASGLIMASPPASAALNPTPDPIWMTNGGVRAIIRYGGYVYIGGQFSKVRETPPTVLGESFDANGLARFDAATGVGDPTWTPDVSWGSFSSTGRPVVHALAAVDGKIFVGGDFGAVDGQPRINFAAVDAVTGIVDPGVTATIGVLGSKSVRALAGTSGKVYVGGYFTTVDGLTRKRLAAFNTDGTFDKTWKPKTDRRVASLAWDCAGTSLFVGGQFRRAAASGGAWVTRETVARFDPVTGAILPWAIPVGTIELDQVAFDLAPTCTQLNVGYGGRNYAVSFDLTDDVGQQIWRARTSGNVQTVAVMGDQVILGGHFSQVNGARRIRIAAVSLAAGSLDPDWHPDVDGSFYGPWDLLVTDDMLYVGGYFDLVGGVSKFFLARFTNV